MATCSVLLTDYQLSTMRLSLLMARDEVKKDIALFDGAQADKEELFRTLKSFEKLSEKLKKIEHELEKLS